jgi:hypothetical protein
MMKGTKSKRKVKATQVVSILMSLVLMLCLLMAPPMVLQALMVSAVPSVPQARIV